MILMELFGRDSCSSLVFHTKEAGASSIVSEWGLVCDLNYKSKVSSTVYQYNLQRIGDDSMIKVVTILQGTMSAFMAGVMIGAFMLGKLADRCSFPEFFLFYIHPFKLSPGLVESTQSPSPCLASLSSTPSLVSPAPSTSMLEQNLQQDFSALETSCPCLSFLMSWWVGLKGPSLEQPCRFYFS